MKVMVTGGAGFIGSHLVDALVHGGHEVIVVDHHRREKMRFPNPAAKVLKVSLDDAELAGFVLKEKPDAICHLAAQISVTRSVAEPVFDATTNVLHAVRLLEAAREAGVKKFVFASSGGAIYGDHPMRPTPEIMDARPISPYGVGKQSFEHYLDLYHRHFGMQTVALRMANVYGPRQMSGGYAGVVPIFLQCLKEARSGRIYGDGSSTRDYLFVLDAVDAFLKALESDYSGVVNVGTGKETSALELWKMLVAIHGQDPGLEFLPDRPGEVARSVLDARLAKQAIGWTPSTTLEDGLRITHDWFMKSVIARP